MFNGTPFLPDSIKLRDQGLRPSVARVLEMIDTTDEAFPRVVAILMEMSQAGVEIDESAVTIALKMGKNRPEVPVKPRPLPRINPGLPMWGKSGNAHSVVYYIRRGTLIKIGTTANPRRRFESLMPDEILAFEPGDRSVEQKRHQQFRHLRHGNGEYFNDGPDLARHIQQVRAANGDPDPTWPTTGTLTTRTPRHVVPTNLPSPYSKEKIALPDAAEEFGVDRNTIYGWVRRRKIPKVGRDERGRYVYYREHVEAVVEHHKTRRQALREKADTR